MLEWLTANHWDVVAGALPSGTGGLPKLILPHAGSNNKRRDEVDMVCIRDGTIVLLEFKPKLSDSIRKNMHDENDIEKLERIKRSFSPKQLGELISKLTGKAFRKDNTLIVEIAIAVGDINQSALPGVTICLANDADIAIKGRDFLTYH